MRFEEPTMITRLLAMTLLAASVVQPPVSAEEMPERVLLWPSFGLVPGERARFTLSVPGKPVRARVQLFDANGIPVAVSDEVTIPAGELHSFDVDPGDVRAPGEAGTGRRQLRASCHVRVAVPGTNIGELAATQEILE
jgi:hypothetical protein